MWRKVPAKLVLVMVDSLSTPMLRRAADSGEAPHFAALLERGKLVPDCVSTFPSVTPVATSAIATGRGPDEHWIPAMNWYHRAEGRYVEYGSSFEATRAFGVFRALYDTVYNLNLAHLNPRTPTFFERLGDAGVRSACTPFLVYRGRTRHQLSLEGFARRAAFAADFRHAVYGPDELFYGELYSSRPYPCRPTLARAGTRDEYSACVGEGLVRDDLFDFLLLSLPDNDHHAHRFGPEATVTSIAKADHCFGRLVEAGGGLDRFLDDHAVILMADHAQVPVDRELPLIAGLAEEWRLLQPHDERPERAELAVSPSARAAAVSILAEGPRFERIHERLRQLLVQEDGVDLLAWLNPPCHPERRRSEAEPQSKDLGAPPAEAVVRSRRGELRFRPGSQQRDRRGKRWDLEGEWTVLGLKTRDALLTSDAYPDPLGRLWAALVTPRAGDLLLSLAPGYECVDWGGASHVAGGSHGALAAEESLGPLLFVNCGPADPTGQAWSVADVYPHVLAHFGIETPLSS